MVYLDLDQLEQLSIHNVAAERRSIPRTDWGSFPLGEIGQIDSRHPSHGLNKNPPDGLMVDGCCVHYTHNYLQIFVVM